MAPILCRDEGVTELLELATTLRIFISCVERYPQDAVAGAVAARAKAPLAQATEFCVRGVLDEFQAACASGNLVSLLSAVWFTREFCESSISARQLVRQYGGVELLGPALLAPEADERLINEAIKLLHYLQGSRGLLEAMPHVLRGGPSAVRTATRLLWQLRDEVRVNWQELKEVAPATFVGVVMSSIQAFPTHWEVHEAALACLSDVLRVVEYRSAFAECGGWSHVLTVLESRDGKFEVHRRGLQILCELQRGGAWGGEHSKRCQHAVLASLEAFHEDDNILEWGFWLLMELGSLPDLLRILQRAGATSNVSVAALRTLRLVHWGQTEASDAAIVPDVVRVVGGIAMQAMQVGAAQALELSVPTLLDVGYEVAAMPEDAMPSELAQALAGIVELTLQVLRQSMMDVPTVRRCLQVVRLFQVGREGSSIQRQVREALLGGPSPDLLQQLIKVNSSQAEEDVFKDVLWAQGVLLGPCAIVRMMGSVAQNLPCLTTGVKIIGQLYGDCEDLDEALREARVAGLQAITGTIQTWPQEVHLITHACYALSAFALHGMDPAGSYNLQHLQYGLKIVWQVAVPVASELDMQDSVNARQKARYLRQEIGRLEMESVKAAPEPVRQELRCEALRVGVAAAQCSALVRDTLSETILVAETTECLRLALVVLGVLGQAAPAIEVMRDGGPRTISLARGAALAIVDLCRLGMQSELKMAGLAEVTRNVHEVWRNIGNQHDPDLAETLSALQFAEDWVASAR